MWDNVTGSVWSQLDGVAVRGPLQGAQLPSLALQTTTWGAWLAEHPDSTTLDLRATGFSYGERFSFGRAGLGRNFRDTLDEIDGRLPENELVIGVLAGSESRAFPIERVPAAAPIQDTVGEVPIVVFEDAGGIPSLAYHRLLTDGRMLDFERRDGAIFDVQTGSRWASSGFAVEGELAGVQLAFVTSFFTEWYGWAAFHPDTTIYEATSEGT